MHRDETDRLTLLDAVVRHDSVVSPAVATNLSLNIPDRSILVYNSHLADVRTGPREPGRSSC
jgi:hypothetical protein